MRLISLADIARGAGVKPAAVSNWRRRRPDSFPKPVQQDGRELFRPEEIAEWLDDRKIDRASLLPGEVEGQTYGDRFRMATGAATKTTTIERMIDYWARTLRSPGFRILSSVPDVLLELVTTRLRDERGWAAIKERAPQDPAHALHEFLRSKGHDPGQTGLEVSSRIANELLDSLDRLRPRVDDSGWSVLTEGLLEALPEWSGPTTEHYTPRPIADLMLSATGLKADDRVCDPCCGTGGLLVRAAAVTEGEVRGHALWSRSAHMARLALKLLGRAGHVTDDAEPSPAGASRKYQVVLANPPFGLRVGEHPWQSRFGPIPERHPEFAWLCDAYERLTPGGRAAILMPNGTTFRRGAERELRAAMVEAGIVERIVALPSGLFKHTGIGVTLWVLRASGSQQVLVVDGTHLGYRVGGTHRGLSRDDIDLLRSPEPHGCSRLVPLAELRQQDFDLTPSRYLAREPAPLGGTLTDRLNALERAERAAREADDRARAQLSRILGGGS